MPCLKILTNLPRQYIPNDFTPKILPLLSQVLKKPPEKCICTVTSDCGLAFGGRWDHIYGAVANLESIGNLGLIENRIIAKQIAAFIQIELKIEPEHFFLSLYDVRAQDMAQGGLTFA